MNVKTALVHSDAYQRFDYGPEHPLRMERLGLTHALMEAYGLTACPGCEVLAPEPAPESVLREFHTAEYLARAPRGLGRPGRVRPRTGTASGRATTPSGRGCTRPPRSPAAARSGRPSWWRAAT